MSGAKPFCHVGRNGGATIWEAVLPDLSEQMIIPRSEPGGPVKMTGKFTSSSLPASADRPPIKLNAGRLNSQDLTGLKLASLEFPSLRCTAHSFWVATNECTSEGCFAT
jgi:hypothetical protein